MPGCGPRKRNCSVYTGMGTWTVARSRSDISVSFGEDQPRTSSRSCGTTTRTCDRSRVCSVISKGRSATPRHGQSHRSATWVGLRAHSRGSAVSERRSPASKWRRVVPMNLRSPRMARAFRTRSTRHSRGRLAARRRPIHGGHGVHGRDPPRRSRLMTMPGGHRGDVPISAVGRRDRRRVRPMVSPRSAAFDAPWTADRITAERAHLLRRLGRYEDAVEAWDALAAGPSRLAIVAAVELAKLHEHRLRDRSEALRATARGLMLIERRRRLGRPEPSLEADLRRRLARLQRRPGQGSSDRSSRSVGDLVGSRLV